MNPHEIPVAGEHEGDLVIGQHERIRFIEDPYVEDLNCKPSAEASEGRDYQRDRAGSKKRQSKTHNRKKAKAARAARKAGR